MSFINVLNIAHAHEEWLSKLDFYKTELEIQGRRLTELIQRNSIKEVTAEAEHFQNQFIIQRNNIDELSHAINEHIHQASLDAALHKGRVEQEKITEHNKIDEGITQFEKSFNEMRAGFNRFVSKWF